MTEALRAARRRDIETLDPTIDSIQPGGGICMSLELLWGRLRRWFLKTFCRQYVERMHGLRQREPVGCPHETIDPRDLKYYRNITGDCWSPNDDPFAWRDRLPFARAGLGELAMLSGGCVTMALVSLIAMWPLTVAFAGMGLFVLWFFRDPERTIPPETGAVVAPADGKIVAIDELAYEPYLEGPAVVVGIFLSVFNVHVNRSPVRARVIGITYTPGKFLNALRPSSARENEQLAIRLEESEPPYRAMLVRQIAGAIARRIVCWARPGDLLAKGTRFGMIKFGSRTELVLPQEANLVVQIKLGDTVKAGSSVVARYL